MNLDRKTYTEIARPLQLITCLKEPSINLTSFFGSTNWLDGREGHIALRWITPGIMDKVKSIAEFRYRPKERPITRYGLTIVENDNGLSTTYELNPFNRIRTIVKDVHDAKMDIEDTENYYASQELANSLGINTVTFEDIDVIASLLNRRVDELYTPEDIQFLS